MIAPFWSDIDLSVGGSGLVYYGQHGRDAEDEKVDQRDAEVLDAATKLIRDDTGDVSFMATSLAKITWRDVAPYPGAKNAATQVKIIFCISYIPNERPTDPLRKSLMTGECSAKFLPTINVL